MNNNDHFIAAQQYIPGGVNSPVRAFKSVDGIPKFIQRAQGAYLYDVDNQRYVDYVGSWGPMILGHAHPEVVQAVQQACDNGLSFGAPTEIETQMAKQITELMPAIEMVRMVSSGTEATMSAVRLARGYTGKDKIIKFAGCYHGHGDSFLIKAGSGALTLGEPDSPGVPDALAKLTLTAQYNDVDSVTKLFEAHKEDIACVIVEPVAGNMNCIPPLPGFLESLRALCDQYNSVLIFDEVMTGFRVALGGAQSLYNVQPDLTTLGKVIGGGMPTGAFGGKKAIMQKLAPIGPVYQAGTLSGNPIAMTAGLTTLRLLMEPNFYQKLSIKAEQLTQGLLQVAEQNNVAMRCHQVGGMFGVFFTDQDEIAHLDMVNKCNSDLFKRFFHGMLQDNIYLAPSAYEAGFISIAHSEQDIQDTIIAADKVMSQFDKA